MGRIGTVTVEYPYLGDPDVIDMVPIKGGVIDLPGYIPGVNAPAEPVDGSNPFWYLDPSQPADPNIIYMTAGPTFSTTVTGSAAVPPDPTKSSIPWWVWLIVGVVGLKMVKQS